MKIFLDTNVLVAASVRQHPHFEKADAMLRRCKVGTDAGYMNADSVLEYHSALTQLPRGLAVPPEQVSILLRESILNYVTVVGIPPSDLPEVGQMASERGLIGGVIYDFYHLTVARREAVDRFYTFNTKHFMEMADPDFRDRIMAPGDQ